jgi:two-component system, chemotaxis family, chemotaxis protein CheY
VGNCNHDHGLIRRMLESHFRVTIDRAHVAQDAVDAIRRSRYDLVLINRILDRDGAEGLELVRRMKSDDRMKGIAVMLVSNYDWAQAAAVEAGARRGFGKAELSDEATIARLSEILA